MNIANIANVPPSVLVSFVAHLQKAQGNITLPTEQAEAIHEAACIIERLLHHMGTPTAPSNYIPAAGINYKQVEEMIELLRQSSRLEQTFTSTEMTRFKHIKSWLEAWRRENKPKKATVTIHNVLIEEFRIGRQKFRDAVQGKAFPPDHMKAVEDLLQTLNEAIIEQD